MNKMLEQYLHERIRFQHQLGEAGVAGTTCGLRPSRRGALLLQSHGNAPLPATQCPDPKASGLTCRNLGFWMQAHVAGVRSWLRRG